MARHGPTCPTCMQKMLRVGSCNPRPHALTRTQEVDYLRANGWTDDDLPELAERCRDCGAAANGYHHPLCCVAICAKHGQRLMCSCDLNPATGEPYH